MMYIIDYSTKNGLGHPAVSIFLSGCDRPVKCEDCHNPELWEPSQESADSLFLDLKQACDISQKLSNKVRVAILGGEPLAEYNLRLTLEIAMWVKNNYFHSEVIVYSWRTIEQIYDLITYNPAYAHNIIYDYFDYGVLGPYDKNFHENHMLPASSNQYIFDFKRQEKLPPIKLKE